MQRTNTSSLFRPQFISDVGSVLELGSIAQVRGIDNCASKQNVAVKQCTQARRTIRLQKLQGVESNWHRRSAIADQACLSSHQQWPLHVPDVRPLNLNLLIAEGCPHLDYIQSIELYTELNNAPPAVWPRSKISNEDLMLAIKNKIVEPTNECVKGVVAYVFDVDEPAKQRRRLVVDTISANVLISKEPQVVFTPIHTFASAAVRSGCKWAATFDFRAYFQFTLPATMRKYFVFKANDSLFQFARLPMGFKHAVEIAHSTTYFITQRALRKSGVFALFDVYIDNVAIVTRSRDEAETLVAAFVEECRYFSVTISESTQPQQSFTHRGAVIDL